MNIDKTSSVSFCGQLIPTHACERLERHLIDVGFNVADLKIFQQELDKLSRDKVLIDSFSHDDRLGSTVIAGMVEGEKGKRPFVCEVMDSVGMIKDLAENIFFVR